MGLSLSKITNTTGRAFLKEKNHEINVRYVKFKLSKIYLNRCMCVYNLEEKTSADKRLDRSHQHISILKNYSTLLFYKSILALLLI